MDKGIFATAINCMDGRVQLPVIQWVTETHGVHFVDMVTEPGADGALARRCMDRTLAIQERVRLSVQAHGSRLVVVVGHHDCAGNPVSDEEHLEHIRQAVAVVRSWALPAKVIGLWVGRNWWAEPVAEPS